MKLLAHVVYFPLLKTLLTNNQLSTTFLVGKRPILANGSITRVIKIRNGEDVEVDRDPPTAGGQ